MWIAKPLKALSSDEAFFFQQLSSSKEVPLSQTSIWGGAIEATGVEVYVAFETEKLIGGLAYFFDGQMECINGPILNWSSDSINEELATFVYALTKARMGTTKVFLKPRWLKDDEVNFSSYLKFPIHSFEDSATKILSLSKDMDVKDYLGAKIRHELSRVAKYENEIEFTQNSIENFYQGLKKKYDVDKTFLPDLTWFKALKDYKIFSAKLHDQIVCAILVIKHQTTATYLFAYEDRLDSAPNISLNLFLQYNIIEWCKSEGLNSYDLGGYKENINSEDDYWGVKVFKDKFPGEIKRFTSPVFIFE
jgi:hypothetical protein